MSYSRARKQRKHVEAWLTTHTCKGAKCSQCGLVFTAGSGDGKRLAIFPNSAGGKAIYVLCWACGSAYQELGLAGVPVVQRDCRLTVAMSPFNPANAAAFRIVH